MAESSPAASTPGAPAADNPLAAFGANEWLVDEMYERYKQDPNSVDKAWWDFFRNYHAEHGNEGNANGAMSKPARRRSRPRRSPRPRRRPPRGGPRPARHREARGVEGGDPGRTQAADEDHAGHRRAAEA